LEPQQRTESANNFSTSLHNTHQHAGKRVLEFSIKANVKKAAEAESGFKEFLSEHKLNPTSGGKKT
jgi:hypothetical protein